MSSSVPPAAPQSVLFAAPHRAMFFAGGLQLVLALLPWAWELVSRVFPLPAPAWPWPPGWGHGLLACYGFFPFFAFGFLLTAMPRRQGLTRRALLRIAEGAAVGLDPLADRIEELPLPFGQGHARLVGGAFRASQRIQGRALRRLAFGLERTGGRFR
jgi:hypothetical protein